MGSASMATLRTRFGKRLRALRRKRDFSQERFAELAEISVDFLSLVERGINGPSFDTLDRMAKTLRVPVMELFDFTEKR
jgi:transcriptional regulator with XRE-family HTH domain